MAIFKTSKKARNISAPVPGSVKRPTAPPLSLNKAQGTQGGGYGEGQLRPSEGEFGVLSSSSSPPSPTTSHHDPPLLPKYTFLPTRVPHRTGSDNSIDSFGYGSDDVTGLRPYGFLGGVGAGVVLGLEDAGVVVQEIATELESRGLTLPLLFSTQALEASQARTKLLIQAYIDSLGWVRRETSLSDRHRGRGSPTTRSRGFSHDLRYAKEYELAWFLRWVLARVTRVSEGTKEALHGLIEWEAYEEWRARERATAYPSDAFTILSTILPSATNAVLSPLFHLLSRFAAHSHLSGLTPQALASLFAPLLFHIPTAAPPLSTHTTFVRAASATEHLLLAYIRSSGVSSARGGLGVADLPSRLREWITGYPAMLPSDADLARGAPRRGARVVRCERATRTVRAYTEDLVAGAEHWVDGEHPWAAWGRVVTRDRGDAGRPKFTAGYRRRMAVKETPPLARGKEVGEVVYGESAVLGRGGAGKGKLKEEKRDSEEEGRWGSLAGKEWSMFEEGGFGGGGEMGDKLRFDLTESAKLSLAQKRRTMSWTEFASNDGGFSRTDPVLSSSLHFSAPISASIAQWPAERTEMAKRLHKEAKEAVPFAYDTSPRFGVEAGWDNDADAGGDGRDAHGRVLVEEAFIDFWADLAMGAGWVARGEMTFREANWAFVEYRAVPTGDFEAHPREDPRRGELCFLFEERVPYDYQYAIANPVEKRSFSLFSRKKRAPAPATTLHAPPSSSSHASLLRAGGGSAPLSLSLKPSESRDGPKGGRSGARANGQVYSPAQAEFDRMLMSPSKTKRVHLGRGDEEATIWHKSVEPPLSAGVPAGSGAGKSNGGEGALGGGFKVVSRPRTFSGRGQAKEDGSAAVKDKEKEGGKGLFGRSLRRAKDKNKDLDRDRERQAEAEVDFELQSASGVESNVPSPSQGRGQSGKGTRGRLEEEKWMDILIANGARRMDRQDASPPRIEGVREPEPGADGHYASAPGSLTPPHERRGIPSSPRPDAGFSTPGAPAPGPRAGPGAGLEPSGSADGHLASSSSHGHHLHSPETSAGADDDIVTPRASAFSSPHVHVAAHRGGSTSSPGSEVEYTDPASVSKPLPVPGTAPDTPPKVPSRASKPAFVSRDVGFDPYASPEGPRPAGYVRAQEQRASFESGSDRADVLAPSPVPFARGSGRSAGGGGRDGGRDTIHGIVDTYRDSAYTASSHEDDTGRYSRFTDGSGGAGGREEMYASEEEEEEGREYLSETELEEEGEMITFGPGPGLGPGSGSGEGSGLAGRGGASGLNSFDDGENEHEHEYEREAEAGAGAEAEAALKPPGMVFNVAPTREPSPGRYQHGQPLQFVHEEDEETASALALASARSMARDARSRLGAR